MKKKWVVFKGGFTVIKVLKLVFCTLPVVLMTGPVCASPYATAIESATGFTGGTYGTPEDVLGAPTSYAVGTAVSMVYPAYGAGVITTINSGQEIIVSFDHDVVNDPNNPYGMDFIVYGNSMFVGSGWVYPDTDMEKYYITTANNGNGSWAEAITVSVSPNLTDWYTYSDGPWADASYFPTQGHEWDYETHAWGDPMDWTKPVDPSLTGSDFVGESVAHCVDLFNGAGGGTGFDLAESGFDFIRYAKVTGHGGEIDAFVDVSAAIPEPGTALLLVSGLLGIMGFRRTLRSSKVEKKRK